MYRYQALSRLLPASLLTFQLHVLIVQLIFCMTLKTPRKGLKSEAWTFKMIRLGLKESQIRPTQKAIKFILENQSLDQLMTEHGFWLASRLPRKIGL